MFTAVASVADRHGRPFPHDAFDLTENCRQRVTIEGIALEGQGSNDEAAGLGHGHGCFGTKLVFLVGLTFADAGHAWFVRAVDLACV